MGDVRLIEVKEEILADNIKVATEVRARLRNTKTMLLNLMSSPGSGKTSLILQTVANLKDSLRLGVIEADIDSTVDAERSPLRVSPPSNSGREDSAISTPPWSLRVLRPWL